MARISGIQSSFNAGELSPEMKGQVDVDQYRNGCQTLDNFIPVTHGPIRKRPGTRFVREVKDSTDNARLFPFEFNNEQAFILEFGDLYIRFYKDGGVILDGASPYELVSPYAHADLASISYAQSGDVLYLAHESYTPYKLSRTTDTDWTIEQIAFDAPPFDDEQISATTMTASARSGTGITLTASAATFDANMVGSYIRFIETLASYYTEWTAGASFGAGAQVHYSDRLYSTSAGGTAGTKAPIHGVGSLSDGGVTWLYENSGEGYAEITAYTSTTVVTATVIITLGNTSTSGTPRWSESAWSDSKGFPRAVSFYEDRLWFAGSTLKPQTLWASQSGDYENHQYGTEDDDALSYTINSQEVNSIISLLPGSVLTVLTAGGEFIVASSSRDEAITPTNVRIARQSTYGARAVRPFRIADVIIFVQRAGTSVREFSYKLESDSYDAVPINFVATHILTTQADGMVFQQEPDQVFWFYTSTGKLVGLTYEKSQGVRAWHNHDVGGTIESLASIPHWDGDQDVTFMLVNRTIDGSTVRYIEYLEKYLTTDYALFVDSALTYDGAAATTITGLDHLEGEEVTILADGYVHPNLTVASGSITLQASASIVNVGLGYSSTVKTMPLVGGSSDGTNQGKTARVTNLVIRLNEAGPGLKYGTSESDLDLYHQRGSTNQMDEPVALYSGDTDILPMPAPYEQSPSIVVQHTTPLPCTILAIMPQTVVQDR